MTGRLKASRRACWSTVVYLFGMMFQIFGKKREVKIARIAVFVFVIALLILGGWFAISIGRYYRAIQNGETNPLLNQRLQSSVSSAIANSNVTDADLRRLYRADAPEIGPRDGLLTIVEFVDFGCPFCRASYEPVREMTTKYKDRIRLVIRDFPIEELHPGAILAAHAARCAKEQDKYWAYHDKLFVNKNAFSNGELEQYAIEVGTDITKFRSCMDEGKYMSAIESDVADGLAAGVGGTPTFFFNGHRIQGALNQEMLEIIIEPFLNPSL